MDFPLTHSVATNDARIARTAQYGMKVPSVLQQNMIDLRNTHPDLKEKYEKFPFEWIIEIHLEEQQDMDF